MSLPKKNLILVNGTMGVGKTATCKELMKLLPACVFLDGDWCWMADPFVVTEETKEMVQRNIAALLNGFLACSAYQNVLFCWVLQEQGMIDRLLSRLQGEHRLHLFTLICSEQALARRIALDVEAGHRSPGLLERALQRLPLYDKLDSTKIRVDSCTALEAAQQIHTLLSGTVGS